MQPLHKVEPFRASADGTLLSDAHAAWARGEFQRCVDLLHGATLPEEEHERASAALLLARAYLRVERPEDARLLLAGAGSYTDPDAVATARMLLGSATARVRSPQDGLSILDDVATYAAMHRCNRAIRAEIDYYRALARRSMEDYARADAHAAAAAAMNVDIISARALALRGWLAADQQQFMAAHKRFSVALEALLACSALDVHLAAMIQSGLAQIEAELRSATFVGDHERRYRSAHVPHMLPPSAAPVQRLILTIADATAFLLDGDATRAAERVWEAERYAGTPAWRVVALAARAMVLRAIGEAVAAKQFAEDATTLALAVDWNETRNEERHGLLILTNELARHNLFAAQAIHERYVVIGVDVDSLVKGSGDPRTVAHEAFAEGVLAREQGDTARAVQLLRHAYSTYRGLGYLWRAALTLIELNAVPGSSGAELKAAARIVSENFPNSFLVPRLGRWGALIADPVGSLLTPTEVDVVAGLCRGESQRVIAQRRGVSVNTIEVHVTNLRRKFGTKSIAGIVAEAIRRGVA